MIVIVTGGRGYNGTGLVEALMAIYQEYGGPKRLFVGDATGADALAKAWVRTLDRYDITTFSADWERHGKAARPRRNAEMVRAASLWWPQRPVICLAAPGGRGTADCVRRCREAGFEVREVTT